MDLIRVFLWITCVFGLYVSLSSCKVCRGTTNGLSHQGDAQHRYEALKARYTNCTLVDGNLEMVFLDQEVNYDLSFLSEIREITGYLLVVSVYSDVLPMPNLRIIRGRSLLPSERDNYSLFIANNFAQGREKIGLKRLLFTSLREIITGDVMLKENKLLCNDNTILWQDIVVGENVRVITDTEPHVNCKPCHADCEEYMGARYCWGPGRDECQILTRYTCSQQCESRCYGRLPNECCHAQCAGGCTGPLKTDCWACRHFSNEDQCVPYCPPPQIYDYKQFKLIDNPDAKYTYGNLCVDECPSYMVKESGACVKECGADKYSVNRTCIKCDGPCPKTCSGLDDPDGFLTNAQLEQFRGCTVINGNLQILESTFSGTDVGGEVHPTNLSVFNEVREITGFLSIQGKHPLFKSASFLASLQRIYGRSLFNSRYAMSIVGTSFVKMGLTNLKEVMNGRIIFYSNPDLCYIEQTNFTTLFRPGSDQKVDIGGNRPQDSCRSNNFLCHDECSPMGCMGPYPTECLFCRHFKLGKMCVKRCDKADGLYSTENGTCHYCHSECEDTCRGPGRDNCEKCLNVRDGPFCEAKCPVEKYPSMDNVCLPCHPFCESGCTGPRNGVGPGACQSCDQAQVDENWKVERCLQPDTRCPDGYFRTPMQGNTSLTGKQVCKQCNPLCRTCNGPGTAFCIDCRYLKQQGSCVKECFPDYYADNVVSECKPCDNQCNQCYGPNVTDCMRCRANKVYLDGAGDSGNLTKFYCTDLCPMDKPHRESMEAERGLETVCMSQQRTGAITMKQSSLNWVIGGVVAAVLVIGVVAVVGFVLCRQRAKSEENKMKFAARFSGLEEGEPLTPTNASPDMATMRLVTESELRRGNIIGSGAFGTVYKGMWVPTNENVKIPVAIKVLQESTTPSQNKELLEEARVMASVDHPYCVRVLAVCMTAQMMLITQLMPFGCLLDYVRKNRSNIGSKVLLNWCTQIAKGMMYLEDRGVVHRDLAARNVLIQSPSMVKITDFGLAKLLDFNEDEYRSSGGKMPIKWLALECIQHRIFTHKSDVWSYGVTVWELFTYGQRPYDALRARDVPDLLEKGERLPQPSICTIDVYMIMIKCWMLDAESRPSFRELAEEFSKMARDPGRYLVIQGDKLMRLPSQTIGKEELLRSMSVAEEGPEEMMDAEDYLQPTSSAAPPPPAANGSVVGKMRDYDNDRDRALAASRGQAACADPYSNHKHKPRPEDGAGPLCKKGMASRDSVNSRYSPDPCKILDDPKEGDPSDPLPNILQPPPMDGPEYPADMNKHAKMPLPVIDEDDYLTPKSSQPSPYMDLIEGKDYLEPVTGQDPHYLEPTNMGGMDNPEYYQAGDGDVAIEGLKSHKEPPRLRSPSDESTASEAEYYNECDQLNHKKGVPVIMPGRTESFV